MTALPAHRGVADLPVPDVAAAVLAAWDAFLDVVTDPRTDLDRPSRLPGWTGKDTCVHLGEWPDAPVMEGLLASARAGGTGHVPSPDDLNAALVAAHRDASAEEVVDALRRARERLTDFFASPDAVELGRAAARSFAGPLPLLGLVHAGTYELAVHAMDLAPCGAPPPPAALLQRGVGALVDVTGGLAARSGVELELTAQTPHGGWRFTSGADGWRTEQVPPGRVDGTGVTGSAADLLDASAGRASVPQLLLTRRMTVQQMHHWMRLAPLLDDVPHLPGGAALKATVSGLHGVGSGVGRLLGKLRR